MHKLTCLLIVVLLIACVDDELDLEPQACFTFVYEEDQLWDRKIIFTNCSENADSYLWDFGDSTTSTAENPEHQYTEDGEFIVQLTAFGESLNDTSSDTVLVNWTQVYKPNIYLYPETAIDLVVELRFPLGGRVVKSVPEYGEGWTVHVNEAGLINNAYDFLFYEAVQPDIWQYEEGWCIPGDSLLSFFEMNLKTYNFSEREIADFTEYWIPLLDWFNYYYIYPQTNETINTVINLRLSEEPDNVGRLFYGIVGSDVSTVIREAKVYPFARDGFTVMEWGVLRK